MRTAQPSENIGTDRLSVYRGRDLVWCGPIGVYLAKFPDAIDAAAMATLEAGQDWTSPRGATLRLKIYGRSS